MMSELLETLLTVDGETRSVLKKIRWMQSFKMSAKFGEDCLSIPIYFTG